MAHLLRLTRLSVMALFVLTSTLCHAQNLLNKTITLDIKKRHVTQVLKTIGAQGGFYFSYNSNIIGRDSLITLTVSNKTVKEVLDIIFDGTCEYHETGKYIVLQKASSWYATGYVIDAATGEKIPYASVYEKQQFVSTLTNEQGYFRLKMKERPAAATIYISKSWYQDTTVIIRGGFTQDITIGISSKPFELDSFVVTQHTGVERTWFGRLFLSSKQRMQSVNLGKYFVDKPYQASVIPGLSTHGSMGSQVVNKFSFNVLGGYTAGVNGFELGGVFNIVKQDVQYAQVGGVFNIVGGKVNGVQFAGVYNQVLEASTGWQCAGICNFVNDSLTGIQVSGVYNHSWGAVKGAQVSGMANLCKGKIIGVQIAGSTNYANEAVNGTQIAGMLNISRLKTEGAQISGAVNYANKGIDGSQISGMANVAMGEMTGTQVSSFVNYAGHLKGAQVGIINLADTSSGVSVGLLNFVWKGYHKLSVSANEVTNLNLSFKTGNEKLYNIFHAGMNAGSSQNAYTLGYGWGSAIKLSKRFSLNPELSGQYVYLGDWDNVNVLAKFHLDLHMKMGKFIELYAGPSYALYYSNQTTYPTGYRKDVIGSGLFTTGHGNNLSSWMGWNVGISFF